MKKIIISILVICLLSASIFGQNVGIGYGDKGSKVRKIQDMLVENGKLLEVSETTDNSLRLAMENIVFN